ncbi:MAG: hypothetical protein KJ558_09010 [Gammaproteobacteria bacterium]|nr:hypothetical protein [Gammaproteobacteria bacterium]MBU1654946.1 hypothetical protein [Gammaproteobacteria bacterium]MBU1960498.1 hypothetical protein [Gammaproteobacteria bacterium]
MKRLLPLLLALTLPMPLAASHYWNGVDVCEANRQTLPPGLAPERLPEPRSQGARLLQAYCTQCHNLPGPDRHTAAEWHDLTGRMYLLMEVSHRFGGLHGKAEHMQPEEKASLLAYLGRHSRPAPSGEPGNPWPALGPFLLLAGVGLARWWRVGHRRSVPCATP